MDRLWYIHTIKYCTGMRMKLQLHTTWMNLTILCHVKDAIQKSTYRMIPFIQSSKTDKANLWYKKRKWEGT